MIVEPIRPPSLVKEELAMSAQNKSSRIDEWMLQKVYRAAGQPAVRLGLRNGVEASPNGAFSVANIVIQDRKTLFRLLLDPEAEFGDAYSNGRITHCCRHRRTQLPDRGADGREFSGPV